MGKCYSKVNRGQRNKSDFYQTPYKMTEALLENEMFDYNGTIFEPACGHGAITEILKQYFKIVIAYDIKSGIDFLNENKKYDYIITNPPYSLALEFIQKCKQIATNKFALLLPLNYLQGQERYEEIYNKLDNYPLIRIYIFSRMPTLKETIRGDGKYETGMQAYAWFIWKKFPYERISKPEIFWIDSKDHIARKI